MLFEALLDQDALSQIEETWIDGGLDDPSWSNVTGHMAAVAALTIALSEFIKFIDLAPMAAKSALIHDAFKRREKEAVQEAQKAKGNISAVYDQQEHTQALFLRKHNWHPRIIEAAQSVGHTSLLEFCQSGKNITLLRKVVHLADDLTLGSSYDTLAARMQYNREKYPTIHQDGPTRYHLSGLTFDIQEMIAQQIINDFAVLADMPPETFYDSVIKRAKEILAH